MHSLRPLAHGPKNQKSWAVVIHSHGKGLLPCSFNTLHDLGATPVVQGLQFWRACFTPIAHGVGSYKVRACIL